MPKKKGLGKNINKSLEVMDELMGCLKKFSGIPAKLKKGLPDKACDEKMVKMINEAKDRATSLESQLEDLENAIKGVKPNKNSRFASRVVSKFLEKSAE